MPNEESKFVLSFDDEAVSCERPDGVVEKIRWGELDQVTVEATLAGPEAPELIWILWGREHSSGCVFPGGATGGTLLLGELETRLGNFKTAAIAEAKDAPENRTYIVWQAAREGRVDPDM